VGDHADELRLSRLDHDVRIGLDEKHVKRLHIDAMPLSVDDMANARLNARGRGVALAREYGREHQGHGREDVACVSKVSHGSLKYIGISQGSVNGH
jgi:hypothetical protein